jgi:hypothetical protein
MITRLPDEFANLLYKLMAASGALSTYCTKHGETELSQFFERKNQQNGLRHYVDEKITAVNPNFMCHKDAAAS